MSQCKLIPTRQTPSVHVSIECETTFQRRRMKNLSRHRENVKEVEVAIEKHVLATEMDENRDAEKNGMKEEASESLCVDKTNPSWSQVAAVVDRLASLLYLAVALFTAFYVYLS